MTAYLVPASRGRYELYSEAPDATSDAAPPTGRLRRWIVALSEKWHELADSAQRGRGQGRLARWRDRAICAVSESIAEQRTLWSLRHHDAALVRIPSTLATADARAWLMAELAHARRHHLRWLAVDLALLVVSGVLALVPGPNLIAYYFAFRVVGHLQTWRGARQGMDRIAWTFTPDDGLAELAALVNEPREARAPRVGAIAERLKLPHLAAFFDRVAIPSA